MRPGSTPRASLSPGATAGLHLKQLRAVRPAPPCAPPHRAPRPASTARSLRPAWVATWPTKDSDPHPREPRARGCRARWPPHPWPRSRGRSAAAPPQPQSQTRADPRVGSPWPPPWPTCRCWTPPGGGCCSARCSGSAGL